MSPQTGSDHGFAVVETFVALAVMALALAAFHQAVGGGYRADARVGLEMQALSRAQSHLDSVGIEERVAPGVTSGNYGRGLSWRLEILPLPTPSRNAEGPKPYWLVLDTFDAAGKRILRLETAKLARTPP